MAVDSDFLAGGNQSFLNVFISFSNSGTVDNDVGARLSNSLDHDGVSGGWKTHGAVLLVLSGGIGGSAASVAAGRREKVKVAVGEGRRAVGNVRWERSARVFAGDCLVDEVAETSRLEASRGLGSLELQVDLGAREVREVEGVEEGGF